MNSMRIDNLSDNVQLTRLISSFQHLNDLLSNEIDVIFLT